MTVAVPGNEVGATMIRTLALRNGRRVETIRGKERYVTSDRGRAVIGPVRHRKRLFRKTVQGAAPTPGGSRLVTMRDMGEQLGNLVTNMNAMGLPTPPPPQEKPNRLRRAWAWWLDRFYSKEWHEGIRNCALDVVAWGTASLAMVAIVKGILWLL